MIQFEIRLANPRDAEAIYNVHRRSVSALCGTAYSESQLAVWSELRTARDYGRSIEKAHVLVAESPWEVIGFAVLGCKSGELHALYVHPEWTGRGVGGRLLTAVEARALELGHSVVTLNATLNAVTFYEAQGYTALGPGSYSLPEGLELRCERMQKPLAG
jgi:putative acetyltransferase